jgi:hypothetical protein
MEFDGMKHADAIIRRCNHNLKLWKSVYASLGVPFEWREPTGDELLRALIFEAARHKDANKG